MIKKILFLLLAVFAVNLFAAETIYAWGYGDMLSRTLMAVKFTFASGDYMGIFKFILLLGLTFALISMMKLGAMGDVLALPKLFFMSVGVSTIFMFAKVDVVVHDLNQNTYDTVTDVPWGIAKPMVWFSGMEKYTGEMLETAFAVPSIMSYNGGGFMKPFGIINASQDMKITSPGILQNINTYMYDCVRGDVLNGGIRLGGITETQLMESGDLWALFGNSNPALFTYHYNSATRSNEYMICPDAYNALNTEINAYVDGDAKNLMAKALGGYSVATLDQMLGQSAQYLTGYTGSTSSFLLQSIMIDQFKGSYQSWTTMNGAGTVGGYGFGKAEQTAQANMIISGMLGSKYIPVIKGFLTILIAAMTPIVVLMLLTPMFWPTLIGYLSSMVWLALWHIGEVILNFIIVFRAESMLSDTITAYGTGGNYTMAIKPVVSSAMMDSMNMASSMYWMIPTIAGFIAGGFAWKSMSGMTGGMTSRVSRGESVSTEVGGATASLGNTTSHVERANMHQVANTSSYGRSTSYSDAYKSETGSNNSNVDASRTKSVGIGNSRLDGDFAYTQNSGGGRTYSSINGQDAQGNTMQGKDVVTASGGSITSGTVTTKNAATGAITTSTYADGKVVSSENNIGGVNQKTTNNSGIKVKDFKGVAGSIGSVDDTITSAPLNTAVGNTITKNAARSTEQGISTSINKGVENILSGQQASSEEANLIVGATRTAGVSSSQTESDKRAVQVANSAATTKAYERSTAKGGQEDWTKISQDQYQAGIKGGGSVDIGKGVKGGVDVGATTSTMYTNKDGNYYKKELSSKETDQFKKDFSSSYVYDKVNQQGLKEGLDYTISGSGGSKSSDTKTSGQSRKVGESLSESMTNKYTEQLARQTSLDDGKALNARVVNDFVNDNYRNHKGGKEGLIRDLVSGDQGQIDNLTKYAANYTGLTKDPKSLFSDVKAKELESVKPDVIKKTTGVEKEGKHSFNVAQTVDNHANLTEAQTSPAIKAVMGVVGSGGISPVMPKNQGVEFDKAVENTINQVKTNTNTPLEKTDYDDHNGFFDHGYVQGTNNLKPEAEQQPPKAPYKRPGGIGRGRRR